MKDIIESMSSWSESEINEFNLKSKESYDKEYEAFRNSFSKDECYLCGKSIKTSSHGNPCLHWLLRRCKFKKNQFTSLYEKYDYHQISSYLRWVANFEQPLKNVNDIELEKSDKVVFQSTIKWKNVEWTFECSPNDFIGHKGKHIDFPHYHFQMKIDGNIFIKFNEFHLPLSPLDIEKIELHNDSNNKFSHSYGAKGAGMQDIMKVDFNKLYNDDTLTGGEFDSFVDKKTIIHDKSGKGISGEFIADVYAESEKSGIPFSKLIQEKLNSEQASVQTIITAAEDVPKIAERTKHKKKK